MPRERKLERTCRAKNTHVVKKKKKHSRVRFLRFCERPVEFSTWPLQRVRHAGCAPRTRSGIHRVFPSREQPLAPPLTGGRRGVMCIVCDVLELISASALALRPHRTADDDRVCAAGVWSPELKHKPLSSQSDKQQQQQQPPSPPSSPPPPVWTPGSSPTPERKSYKPVRFESPTLSRKRTDAVNARVRYRFTTTITLPATAVTTVVPSRHETRTFFIIDTAEIAFRSIGNIELAVVAATATAAAATTATPVGVVKNTR